VNIIPKSIQLIAGRTGREYNQRKSRKGAFWEDRYHATAVKTGNHLTRCLAYIDLNMVRAGVVRHPSEWNSDWKNEMEDILRFVLSYSYPMKTKPSMSELNVTAIYIPEKLAKKALEQINLISKNNQNLR
jgi:hypothetical protein